MSAQLAHETQQSTPLISARAPSSASVAGCWSLAPRRALSLRPTGPGVLELAQGQVWLTVTGALPGAPADQLLRAGDRLTVAAGVHVVMEAWDPRAPDQGVAFRWDRVPLSATAGPVSAAASDWHSGVVQPLADLAQALARAGRALLAAGGDAGGASGRLAAGLLRFAMRRLAPCAPRHTA